VLKRLDHYRELRAFIVECPSCGFIKYLKRNVSLYTAWQCGYKTGYDKARYQDEMYIWFLMWVTFVLGILVTLSVINITEWLRWIGGA